MSDFVVEIKKLYDDSILPKKAHDTDAGYDLYAHHFIDYDGKDKVFIAPHASIKVGTGVAMTAPQGYFGGIFARSGMALKRGLVPKNCVGVCDESYTNEYIVVLQNITNQVQEVSVGERIAQLIFLPYINADLLLVDELKESDRGMGGFGSSGTN